MQVVGSGTPDSGLNLSENKAKEESVSGAQSIDIRAEGDTKESAANPSRTVRMHVVYCIG